MKVLFCILSFLAGVSDFCFAQYNVYQTEYNFQNRPYGFMASLPPAPKDKPTSIFLYPEINIADVFFKDSTKLEDLRVKLDIKLNTIDIHYNNDIKVLPVSRVLALTVKKASGETALFLNGSFISATESIYRDQLVQVLSNGAVGLYCKAIPVVIEPSPSPALMMDDATKIVIEKNYLISYKSKVVVVESKSKLKIELSKLFDRDVSVELKGINPRNEEDLVLLIERLNNSVNSKS